MVVVHGALRHQYLVTLGVVDPNVVQSALPLQVAVVAQVTLEARFGAGRSGGSGSGRAADNATADRGRRGAVVPFGLRVVGAAAIAAAPVHPVVVAAAVFLKVHPVNVTDQVLAFGERGLRARRALVHVFRVGRRLVVGRARLAGRRAVQAQYVPVAVRLGRERQRTVFALVRLFAGVRADVPFQRRRPRERQIAKRAEHAVGRGRVRAHLLPLFPALVFVVVEIYVDVVVAGVGSVGRKTLLKNIVINRRNNIHPNEHTRGVVITELN